MEGLEHPNIKLLVLDVTNTEQIEKVVSTIIEEDGRIDVLVNNAGTPCPGMFSSRVLGNSKD